MTYDEIKGYEIVTVSNSSTFRGIKTGLGTIMGRDVEIVCPRCKQVNKVVFISYVKESFEAADLLCDSCGLHGYLKMDKSTISLLKSS